MKQLLVKLLVMFKIGKQKSERKSKESQLKTADIDSKFSEQIHVMPKRFYVAPKKKHTALIIIIIVGILLIGGLAAAAIYLSSSLPKTPATEPAVNANQPINTNINQEPEVNQNLNANFNINEATTTQTNTNSDINANANLNSNINANSNINTNVNISVPRPLPQAADNDNDGLTLVEENLFGTDSNNPDTDSDTYNDGAEILAGYDPTKPAVTLVDSGLFKIYSHALYSMIYPNGTVLREQGENKDEVLFIAGGGEFIEVIIIPNVNKLSLTEWYQEQFPQISLAQATVVKIGSLNGLRHPDSLSYYLISPDKSNIFLLTYNVGNLAQTNFATTFQAMVKSFKLVSPQDYDQF